MSDGRLTVLIQLLERPATRLRLQGWIHSTSYGSLVTLRSDSVLERLPARVR